jgi:Tim10/DDP family zinc finger
MEHATSNEAHKFYAVTRYLYQVNTNCFEKCVVDFQTKDIGAMEKECAAACL